MSESNTEKIINDENAEARWYVVHTYSGYENKVATDIEKVVENRKLSELIQEVRVPMEKVVEVKDNQKKEVERKMYPGYVLVKMVLTEDAWYVVRNTRGVTGFVGPGSKPVPLTEREVISLGLGGEIEEVSQKEKIDFDFSQGDQVKVKEGPLSGYTGEVESADKETGMAKVCMFMFGRKMNVEVNVDQLEKI